MQGRKLAASSCARLRDVSDPELLLLAEIHGRAALIAELRSLLGDLADGARDEAGCVGFQVLAGVDGPGEFVLLSRWRSEDALRTHYDTTHYRYYRDQVGPLLARPSDVVIYHIAATVRARDPDPPDPGLFG